MQTLFEKKIYLSDKDDTVFSVKIEERGKIWLTIRKDNSATYKGFISYSGPVNLTSLVNWERDVGVSLDQMPQIVRDEINQQLVRLKGIIAFL